MAHMLARIPTLCVALVLAIGVAPAGAQQTAAEPIRYTVSFPAPHTHYLEVSAVVPTARQPQVELMMAVWTPGSYLVREFARNVEAVTAAGADGRALNVEKTEKNRWRIATGGAPTVTVKYGVYAREMSVRTNWVDDEMAILNGAPTFITLVETPSRRAHEVKVVLRAAFGRIGGFDLDVVRVGGGETERVSDRFECLAERRCRPQQKRQ
jgi:hypothetical protein